MRRAQFKKHLDQLGEEELREELLTLFTKLKEVKEYYLMELGSEEQREKIYEKAKLEIASKYTSKSFRRPRRPRIQKVNTIIKALEKQSVLPYEMIDIYLFNAETAVDFMIRYHFDSTPLRNTIISSFSKALDTIRLDKMEDVYKDRCMGLLERLRLRPWIRAELKGILKEVYSDV